MCSFCVKRRREILYPRMALQCLYRRLFFHSFNRQMFNVYRRTFTGVTNAGLQTDNNCTPNWISEQDIKRYLTYEDLIPAIEGALASFSQGHAGGVVQPVRTSVGIQEHQGTLLVKSVYTAKDNVLAVKLISRYPENAAVGLPSHMGFIVLFDPACGAPYGIMDAKYITSMRTAAASAVASKYLAIYNPKILAIIGAGVQAVAHIEGLRKIAEFEEVRIYSRNFNKVQKIAEEHGCIACRSSEEAVTGADIVTTTTTSRTPVICRDWVKDGAHINIIGASQRDRREIDPDIMKIADVYTDSKETALQESGDIITSGVEVAGEIGELVLGIKKANRNKITVFKSLGMAIEDAVAAQMVYDKIQGTHNCKMRLNSRI